MYDIANKGDTMTLEEFESLAYSNNFMINERYTTSSLEVLQAILDTTDIWNQEKTLNYRGWDISEIL